MKFPSKITVAALDMMPFFRFEKDGKAKGAEGNLLEILSQALGFDYQIIIPKDKAWGVPAHNGTWTGMINMVLTGEADIAMCSIGYSEERHSVIDFSFSYSPVSVVFATDLPKPLSKAKIYLNAFDLTTWICLFLLLLLLPFALNLITGQKSSYADQLLTVFGNLLRQPTIDDVFMGRFVTVCWWFVSLILSTSFGAGLSSSMAIPFTEPVMQNFLELAAAMEGGSYRVYTMKGTGILDGMRDTLKPQLIKMADEIEKNDFSAPIGDYFKEFKPKTAMLGSKDMFNYWYGKPPLSTKHIAQNEDTISGGLSIIFGKDFCCKKQLNDAILKVLGGGIHEKLLNDEFFKSWLKAPKEGLYKSDDVPLTLNDVSGAFFFLLCGFVVSFVVFLCELAYRSLRKE